MNPLPIRNYNAVDFPLAPRQIQGGPGGSIWFTRIFILPHTLVGLGAFFVWLFVWLWILFGTDTAGKVTGSKTSYSRKGGTTFSLQYQYDDGQQIRDGSDGVKNEIYQKFQGQKDTWPAVTVHHFELGPIHQAKLKESQSLWAVLGFLTLWMGFWNSVVGIFVYQIWVKPLQLRWLCRHGAATTGRVTGKRTRSGKSTTYYVSYVFTVPGYPEPIKKEMVVNKAGLWTSATQDQQITVLYSVNKPKRLNAVYEFSGYTVV